ncbi:MAG: hypothetical protein DDT23_00016 [candidate division WS2 bacterium]|nr:hypothetical protein [Candidatus Lithacetigena glycinireducens]
MAISIGDALLKLGLDKTAFDSDMKNLDAQVKTSMKKLQTAFKVGGAAITAMGAAGLKFVSDARVMNAQLGQTALILGITTKEIRDLALATADVSFPIKSVADTFELLSRAGVKNTEDMKANAKAFDALADATGSSAEVIAGMLIPAFRVFGKELPKTSKELDIFTWLSRETTVNLGDFSGMLTRLAPQMIEAGISMEDAVIALAALEERGITGRAAMRELNEAIGESVERNISLHQALGITTEEVGRYNQQISESVGITDKYAAIADKQFGIMDKLKHAWSELTFAAGSFLTPLEPILTAMTALGPVMMFFGTATAAATIKTIKHTAALIAKKVALTASTVAIKAATAAQWLWNAAMTANPIGIVIAGIAALIAAIILIAKNWDWIREKTINVWERLMIFFRGIVERIGGIFAGLKEMILSPFRAALSGIEAGINWLIRQLNKISFKVPDWVPLLGGKTFGLNIPEITLPKFAHGGLITEPTLLYGLRSKRPYAVAGESGPERISPITNYAGATYITHLHIGTLIADEAGLEKLRWELQRIDKKVGLR